MAVTSLRCCDVLSEVLQLHKGVVPVETVRYYNDIKGKY